MNISKKAAVMLTGLGLVAGSVVTIGLQTKAQTSTPGTTSGTNTTTTRPQGHMPIGQDGNVTAINGTTITMQEEADESGGSYTVDASKAAFSNQGTTSSITDIKVGDKIFVQGTVSGTNVAATSVSVGHPGGMGHGFMRGPNNDTETNDGAASSSATTN